MTLPNLPSEPSYDVTPEHVARAAEIVQRWLLRTPLLPSPALAEVLGRPVFLKCENQQFTGSFKVRGALTRMSLLEGEQERRGVVAASAGNPGLGVAWSSRSLGQLALVVVPSTVARVKLEGLRAMAVKVRVHGDCYDEAEVFARQLAEEAEATFVSPFDDPWIMAGNGGTVGMEIMEQLPDVSAVVAPLGGGGLVSGLAAGLDDVPVVGVNSEASPAMARSLAEGKVHLTYDSAPTIAEGLEGGVSLTSAALCARGLHAVEVVPEALLRRAIRFMVKHHGAVVEGAAAAGVAALLSGKPVPGDGPVCVVVTGRNIDRALLREILREDD